MVDATVGEPKVPWHLDKRVNVSVIIALIINTAGLGIWIGTLQERVSGTERWINDNKKIAAQLAVLDERTESMKTDLSDIKQAVVRLGELQWHQDRP